MDESNNGGLNRVCFAKKSTFWFCRVSLCFPCHFAFADNGEGAPLGAN